VSLDSRFITPFGVLNQTAILGPNLSGNSDVLRLDTYAARVDPEALNTYRAGDTVTGGLSWTHPIRIGGAQLQHDYTFRTDLVTASLPSVSGSAAVPSTVDVYINNVRTISQQVSSGPYQITNLPIYSGGGDARVVVRDASGKETTTTVSFFSTPRLLREGVYESSIEMGVPRLRYGLVSDDYDAQAVGAATLRKGVLDWLTVEAHGEGGLGLVNGGVGVVTRAGTVGVVNFALSGSTEQRQRGAQSYGSFDTKLGPVSFHISSQRALGGYDDLAAATARLRPSVYSSSGTSAYAGSFLTTKQIRSLDGVSFSVPIEFDSSSFSASFLQAKTIDGQSNRIATVTYSRPLFVDASFYATAFRDFADAKGAGIFLGVTMPLGKTRAAPLVGQNAIAPECNCFDQLPKLVAGPRAHH
jgi:outer membrane usher protein